MFKALYRLSLSMSLCAMLGYAADPIALYECEDSVNDTSTAQDYNLTDNGTISYSTTAAVGTKSCSFSGDDELTNAGFSNDTTNTVAFWIKSTSTTDANITTFDNGSGGTSDVYIDSTLQNYDGSYGAVVVTQDRTLMGVVGVSLEGAGWILNGSWWHIAVVTGGGTNTLYINGKAMTMTDDGSSVFADTSFDLETTLKIGSANFSGLIDDFRVYDTPLSASEVMTLCQMNSSATCGSWGESTSTTTATEEITFETQSQSGGENSAPPAVTDSQVNVSTPDPSNPNKKTIKITGGFSVDTWFEIYYRGSLIAETQPGAKEVTIDLSAFNQTKAVDGITVCAVNNVGSSCNASPVFSPWGLVLFLTFVVGIVLFRVKIVKIVSR